MFGRSTAALEARVTQLEHVTAVMRREWLEAQQELEELHRRNLNVIRSLRRAAAHQEARTDDDEGYDQASPDPTIYTGTVRDLERGRRMTGG